MPIIPIIGFEHPPIGYNIPGGDYTIQMHDFTGSHVFFSAFSDSSVFCYVRNDAIEDQFDYLNYDEGLSVASYDIEEKEITLQAIKVEDDNEKVIYVQNISMAENDILEIDIIEDVFKLSCLSDGMDLKAYDLTIQFTSEIENCTFQHSSIDIETNSVHYISPDWGNLNIIPIYIDNNMDGVYDDTLYVNNQFVGNNTPATGNALNNDNIYIYPNPFNPDVEFGTIRYSLSLNGNITIRVFDITGNLVRTLIKNRVQYAEEEQYIEWDGRSDNGKVVANGVYFYVIESSSGERAVGKAAVLR